MRTDKKWLSRQECAKALGVDVQTISNYIDAGLLTAKKRNIKVKGNGKRECVRVSRASFDEFKAQDWEEINRSKQAVDYYKFYIKEQERKYCSLFNLNNARYCWVKHHVPEILTMIASRTDVRVPQEQMQMLEAFVNGTPTEMIARMYNCNERNVQYVLLKIIRRMSRKDVMTYYTMLDTLHDVMKRNQALISANCVLRQVNESTGKSSTDERKVSHIARMKALRLEDFAISTRCKNCLRMQNITTMYDLLRIPNKLALMQQARNFGRKSLTELDELMEQMNLRWGMYAV